MTTEEARQAWYLEMVEQFTPSYGGMIMTFSVEIPSDVGARLAAHFGRLALGEMDEDICEACGVNHHWEESNGV